MGDSSCYPSFARSMRAHNRRMVAFVSCLAGGLILIRHMYLRDTAASAASLTLLVFPAMYTAMFYLIILPKHMRLTMQEYMQAKYPQMGADTTKMRYVRSLCRMAVHRYYQPGMFRPITWCRVLHISLLEVETLYLMYWEEALLVDDDTTAEAKKSRG